jgi:hypothetical protein
MNMNTLGFGGGSNPLDSLTDPLGKNAATDATRDAGRVQAAAYGRGIDEQRRQFDLVQQLLAPFVGAGRDALPGVAAAGTVGGFDERIAQILGTDTFKALLGERTKAVGHQLSQGGLTRSGVATREAAKVPTDLALAIEQALFGRQSDMLRMGQASAVGQAAQGSDISARIAQLMGQQGEAVAGGIIGGQQARAAITGQVINAGATAAAIMFSDPRLKENMEPIGKIGPLTLFEWDWKAGVSKLIGKMSIGFSADEVHEHFPHHVVEVHGFRAVNYPALTDELRARYVGAEA